MLFYFVIYLGDYASMLKVTISLLQNYKEPNTKHVIVFRLISDMYKIVSHFQTPEP